VTFPINLETSEGISELLQDDYIIKEVYGNEKKEEQRKTFQDRRPLELKVVKAFR
jgi:hypothetical protein